MPPPETATNAIATGTASSSSSRRRDYMAEAVAQQTRGGRYEACLTTIPQTQRFASLSAAIQWAVNREWALDHNLHLRIVDRAQDDDGATIYSDFAYLAPYWLAERDPKERSRLVTPLDDRKRAEVDRLLRGEAEVFACHQGDRRPLGHAGLEALGPSRAVDAPDVCTVHWGAPRMLPDTTWTTDHFFSLTPAPCARVPKEWVEPDGRGGVRVLVAHYQHGENENFSMYPRDTRYYTY